MGKNVNFARGGAVALCAAALACQQASVECGPGTTQVDKVCVPAPLDAAAPGDASDSTPDARPRRDAGPADATPTDADPSDVGLMDSATQVDAGPVTPDAGEVQDPGPPPTPSTIDVLSIALRTDYGLYDGTDANQLSVCLTANDCFRLNIPNVDDFRRGELDTYSFEAVGLPRSQVDRVEIRSVNGSDAWRAACLQVMFDGEPVYCQDQIGVRFGSDPGDTPTWRDPAGLGLHCGSCGPTPITHGPLVGAVTASTARVLVRTDATRRLGVQVIDSDTGVARRLPYVYPRARRDFTEVITIDGLTPSTRYSVLFDVQGVLHRDIAAFDTAPPPGSPTKLKVAFGSCSRLDDQPIFEHIRRYGPDMFFFVGDNHYANSGERDALRWYYQWGLSRAHRSALLAETSVLATWDDHDYTGNNTDGADPGKDTALRVFKEYWANPSFGTPQTKGVFFTHQWGDVQMFFVDDRYWRGFDDSILGQAQTDWLQDALAASTATFKLVICGSQWTAADSSDSWAAFLPARDRLFDFIRDRGIEGVVLLSGDVHRSELRSLPRSGAYDLPEIVSSPLANSNSPCRTSGELRACFDQASYFATLDIDTATTSPSLTARIIDESGRQQAEWRIPRSALQ